MWIAIAFCLLYPLFSTSQERVFFDKTKVLIEDDGKQKEERVDFEFTDTDTLRVTLRKRDTLIAEIPFDAVTSLVYDDATRRRTREGAAVAATASLGVGAVLMFVKTTSHWLLVEYEKNGENQELLLRLDKNDYKDVIRTAESRIRTVTEGSGELGWVDPTAGSENVNEVIDFEMADIRDATKVAMQSYLCDVKKEKNDKIECKRKRGQKGPSGSGGEKVTAKFSPTSDGIEVEIKTGKGFAGRLGKKNWSTPIYQRMMEVLQSSPSR